MHRSFDDSIENYYSAVSDHFVALYGDIDERGADTAKLFHVIQRADQYLNYFVSDITLLANKAFPTDKDPAQVQAKEAFLKCCIHQSERDFVFEMGTFNTSKEAVNKVKCLVEVSSNKWALIVCAFSLNRPDNIVGNTASVGSLSEGQCYDSFSPDRGHNEISGQDHQNFSPDRGCYDFSHVPEHRDFLPNRGHHDISPRGCRGFSPEWSGFNFPSGRFQKYGRNLSSDYSC